MGSSGFYWVFTRISLVLLGLKDVFTEFQWVLLGFTGF